MKLMISSKIRKVLSYLGNSVNETGLTFVTSLLDNTSKEKPYRTLRNKVFTLTFYESVVV